MRNEIKWVRQPTIIDVTIDSLHSTYKEIFPFCMKRNESSHLAGY